MCVDGVWVCPRYPPTEKQNGARLPVQSWSPSVLPLWVGSKGASFALNRSVVERKEAKTVFGSEARPQAQFTQGLSQ